jgi:hypothetical protein
MTFQRIGRPGDYRPFRTAPSGPETYDSAVAPTCPHGLPPSECLICPTLPQPSGTSTTPSTMPGPPTTAPRHRGSVLHVAGMAGAIVLIGLVAWAVAGVVFAILHVLELLAVAAAAGWVGYRLGHFRGARSHRS